MLNTSNDQRKLLPNFEHLFATTAQAPGGVARLRELILTLAVQGKLVAQDPSDEPASELLKKIRAEKDRLIAEGKIKKDKPLTEVTDEENSFELPVGWEYSRIGTITSIITGRLDANAADDDGIYPFFTCSQKPSKINSYSFDCSAVLLAGNGDFNLKKYSGKFDAYQRTYVIEPILIGVDFLYLTFQKYIGKLTKNNRGSAIPYLKIGDITEPVIPLPPLAEQFRIVTRVEELMRLCDALEEKGCLEHTQHQQLLQAMLDSLTQTTEAHELASHWQRLAQHFDLLIDRPEAVDALEQTILQLAVRGLLVPQDPSDEPASELLKKIRAEKDRLIAEGKIKKDKPLAEITDEEKPFELPVGWEWVRLGELLERLSNGYTGAQSKNPTKYPLTRIETISHSVVDFNKVGFCQDIIKSDVEKFKLFKGDILLSHINSDIHLGKTAIYESDELLIHGVNLLLLRPFKLIDSNYLNIFINQQRFSGYFLSIAQHAIGQASINQAKLRVVVTALPPLAEQSRIVARVTELRALCQQLREKLTQARTTQTQLAQAWVEQAAA